MSQKGVKIRRQTRF